MNVVQNIACACDSFVWVGFFLSFFFFAVSKIACVSVCTDRCVDLEKQTTAPVSNVSLVKKKLHSDRLNN